MSEKKRKIGEGTLAAYGRQGLAEIRGALYGEGSVVQPTDAGMWGNRTHGEIADERRGRTQGDERGQEPSAEQEQDRESARDKLLAKYDSRVHEERASEHSVQRDGDGPSMERD